MPTMKSIDLLSNAAATSAAADWPGGVGSMFIVGTWAGATAKLQTLGPDGTTWLDVGSNVTFTANGLGGFILPAGPIRVAISGGPPSAVYARVAGVPQ